MSQEHLNRNLQSLRSEFRMTGKALKGHSVLEPMIAKKQFPEIDELLRHHRISDVEGEELVQRFQIDSLIEYYNLLLVAVFAGYVPSEMDQDTLDEINRILGCKAVMPYYNQRYLYKMTEYTLRYAQEKKSFSQNGTAITLSILNDFISLNRYLKSDKDLERFLGMLDHVSYGDEDLSDFLKTLGSFEELSTALTRKSKTESDRAVVGFIKYSTFVSQLKELITSAKDYPMLQSSLWMYHGYYFDRMNTEMRKFMDVAFLNLEKAMSDETIFARLMEDLTATVIAEELEADQLTAFAHEAIRVAKADMEFILDKKWGDELNNYFAK